MTASTSTLKMLDILDILDLHMKMAWTVDSYTGRSVAD